MSLCNNSNVYHDKNVRNAFDIHVIGDFQY